MAGGEFPYSVGPEDNPINYHMNVQDQISMYKDNEKQQKAPPILPFELDHINAILGETVVSLATLRNILYTARSNENIDNRLIDAINDKIDIINELIMLDIPEDLAKIAI